MKEGSFTQKGWNITGNLKNSEFNGLCTIKGTNAKISVDYTEGKKNGFLTMVKKNDQGK